MCTAMYPEFKKSFIQYQDGSLQTSHISKGPSTNYVVKNQDFVTVHLSLGDILKVVNHVAMYQGEGGVDNFSKLAMLRPLRENPEKMATYLVCVIVIFLIKLYKLQNNLNSVTTTQIFTQPLFNLIKILILTAKNCIKKQKFYKNG